MKKKRAPRALRHSSTVVDVVDSGVLDHVHGIALSIYLRLLAIAHAGRKRRIEPTNTQLCPGRRAASVSVRRSLRCLEVARLVRVRYAFAPSGRMSRTIELLA